MTVPPLLVEGGGVQAAAGLVEEAAGIQVDGGRREAAALQVVGAAAAAVGRQGEGIADRIGAAGLGEGAAAGVADVFS